MRWAPPDRVLLIPAECACFVPGPAASGVDWVTFADLCLTFMCEELMHTIFSYFPLSSRSAPNRNMLEWNRSLPCPTVWLSDVPDTWSSSSATVPMCRQCFRNAPTATLHLWESNLPGWNSVLPYFLPSCFLKVFYSAEHRAKKEAQMGTADRAGCFRRKHQHRGGPPVFPFGTDLPFVKDRQIRAVPSLF